MLRPLKPEDLCAFAMDEIRRARKGIFLIQKVFDEKRYRIIQQLLFSEMCA